MTRVLFLAALLALTIATPADAGFVGAAIAAFGAWFQTLGVVGQIVVRLVGGLALNAISRLLQRQPEPTEQGLTTEITLAGGANPDSLIAGWYATAGAWVSPWLQHGSNNSYNSQVIDLSCVPSEALQKVFVNGSPIALGEVPDPDFGYPDLGEFAGHLWIKFLDGSQVATDPLLLSAGGGDPDFPWTADMIGTGRTFVIATYKFNREIWKGVPQFRFALHGARFYDMRKDGSIGGVGAHRHADPATWEYTDNPVVMASHIALGYQLPDGNIYGGDYRTDDIPLALMAAAANKADALFDEGAHIAPTWRAGAEIRLDQPPARSIELLLATCDGEVCDEGGTLIFKLGAPALPVAFLTDADAIVTKELTLDPFPGLDQTVNGVSITYPEPASAWESIEAPPIYSPDLEAEDGDRRLLTQLSLPMCPYAAQVQRLGQAVVRDARRFRTHVLTLPPDFAWIPALHTISWTSERNGYDAKLFEIQEKAVDLFSYQVQVTLREVDPADYDFSVQDLQPVSPPDPAVTLPPEVALANFTVQPVALADANGNDRRPGLAVTWTDGPDAPVELVVQLAQDQSAVTQAVIGDGTVNEAVISDGILPGVTYRVRGKVLADRPATWTSWVTVTTTDARFDLHDLTDGLGDRITNTEALAGLTATALAEQADRLDLTEVDLELRETGERGALEQLDRLTELLISAQATLSQTQSRIADAGIYVDPDSGTVQIEAFRRLDETATILSQTLDAQAALISQRVTVTEMNQALSALVLDPSQVPLLDELELRVTTAESEIDGLEATITQKADTVTVSGVDARLVTAETEIDGLQGQIVQKVDIATFTPVEQRLTTAESTLSGFDGAAFQRNLTDIRRLTDEVDATNEQTLAGLLNDYAAQEALRVDLAYARQDILARVSDDREASASARLALGARIDDAVALVETETLSRATADQALASDVTQLQADLSTLDGAQQATASGLSSLDGRVTAAEGTLTSQGTALTQVEAGLTTAEGEIDTLQTDMGAVQGGTAANASALSALDTRVTNAEGSLASQATSLTALTTTVGDNTSAISQTLSSVNGIRASYGIEANVNGVITGYGLVSDLVDGNPVSEFYIQADRFILSSPDQTYSGVPFQVFTSPTTVNGRTIPAGVYAERAMFHEGFFESLSAVSATLGSFSTAETGERVEITDDVIKVYDGNDVLRVQIGDLAA